MEKHVSHKIIVFVDSCDVILQVHTLISLQLPMPVFLVCRVGKGEPFFSVYKKIIGMAVCIDINTGQPNERDKISGNVFGERFCGPLDKSIFVN